MKNLEEHINRFATVYAALVVILRCIKWPLGKFCMTQKTAGQMQLCILKLPFFLCGAGLQES